VGVSVHDIEKTLFRDRSVVRTWAMRGTLHLIAVEDLSWLLPVLAPALLPRVARRSAQLGMDESFCRRRVGLIKDALGSHGPMTPAELAGALAVKGADVSGQRAPALLSRACLEEIVCHGPPRSEKPTYVLLSDWIKPMRSLTREAGLREVVFRYISAFGPASPEDLAAWSGLPVRLARSSWSAVSDHLTELEVAGRSAWVLRGQARDPWVSDDGRRPVVRLLAGFDTYLLGYRDRTLAIDPRHSKRINAGGGLVKPTILIDGRVAGTWHHGKIGRSNDVMLEAFSPIPADAIPELDAELADVNRFLGATGARSSELRA
jgi:hypothetical protein